MAEDKSSYLRAYYQTNAGRLKERSRQYYLANRERILEQNKNWHRSN